MIEGLMTRDNFPRGKRDLSVMKVRFYCSIADFRLLTYMRPSRKVPLVAFIVIDCLAEITIQEVSRTGVSHSAFVWFW